MRWIFWISENRDALEAVGTWVTILVVALLGLLTTGGLLALWTVLRQQLGTEVLVLPVSGGQPFCFQLPPPKKLHRIWLRLELGYDGPINPAGLEILGEAEWSWRPNPSVELSVKSHGQPLVAGQFQPRPGAAYRYRRHYIRGVSCRVSYQKPVVDLPLRHGPAEVNGCLHFQDSAGVLAAWILVTHHR